MHDAFASGHRPHAALNLDLLLLLLGFDYRRSGTHPNAVR